MSGPEGSESISHERTDIPPSAQPDTGPVVDALLKATIVCADEDPTALERLRVLLNARDSSGGCPCILDTRRV
jgi:hypothetical protein